MDIHEYQAKELLSRYQIHIPRGGLAYSPEQAAYRASEIGGDRWVVKAQIHSGARRAAALGIEGKWAIHPSQIALANEIFSPPEKEVDRARRIIDALKVAESQGKGAASLDGKMIDAASERMARNVLATHDAITTGR